MTTNTERAVLAACDHAHRMIEHGAVFDAMEQLHQMLHEIRAWAPDQRLWYTTVANHPLMKVLQRDPLTHHAFIKPRGYPGDAELLDYMYGISVPHLDDDLVRCVHAYNIGSDGCCSVRERRKIMAEAIDRAADELGALRVLSVAYGHLREAELSTALRVGRIEQLIALDQDARSLAVVQQSRVGECITTTSASVLHLIAGNHDVGRVDLVYSAGLYDYLAEDVARKLTAALLEMLNSGGRLLVANVAPNLVSTGYMEAFMDWHLIYRDEEAMQRIVTGLDRAAVSDLRIVRDSPRNVVYLEIQKG